MASFEVSGNTYTQAFIDSGGTAIEDSNATWNALSQKVVAAEAGFTTLAIDATAGLILTAAVTAGTNAGTAKIVAAPSAGSGGGVNTNDVLTVAKGLLSITAIDSAIEGVSTYRGELGAAANRLEHTVDNLMSRIENVSAARSQIQDADFATESAKLAKAQVLQQAGTAMLAQANASGQGVLSLLK
jgi:flagellin